MNLATISAGIGIVTALGLGGWNAKSALDQKADRIEVAAVDSKADVSLTEHINYISAEVSRLESKFKHGQATEYEKEQLKYLRQKMESLQTIQRKK